VVIELPGRPDDQLTAYPGSPFQVLPGVGSSKVGLPAGHGGIAVDALAPAASGPAEPPIVGVDGKPAAYGFGRAVVVVPAGERLLEVQQAGRPRQASLLTVEENRIVEFEYSSGKPAARRRPGQSRAGLLDGVEERLDPYVAWGGLVIGLIVLVSTLVIIGIMLWNGEPAVALLAAVPGGFVTVAAIWTWKSRRRPKRRKGGR
jgi:hypothetical protein